MRIKELRTKEGLARTQLPAEVGVSQSVISEWEKEVYLPKARDLPRLAHVLGCSISDLFFYSVVVFAYVELMRGLQRGFVPKRCANCGRWFLQTPGASYNYCDQPAPNGEDGQTCREVGSTKSFRAKVENNDIWKVHQRAYKKYFARTKKGTVSKTDFEAWERKSEKIREKALEAYEKAQTEDEKAAIVDQVTRDLNRL